MPTGIAARLQLFASERRKLPPKVLALIFAALGLSIALAGTLALNLSRMRESFASVRHTNEVLRQLSVAERGLLEAESAERGYLLTAEPSYLENHKGAQVEIPRLFSALRNLVSDNPVQVARVDELRANIDARLDEFRRAIELGPSASDGGPRRPDRGARPSANAPDRTRDR